MKGLTGLAALLTAIWAILMGTLLTSAYTFPHRFPHEIDSPVLALELASNPSEVNAVLQRNTNDAKKIATAARALLVNTKLDLVFILLYAAYLLLLGLLFEAPRKWLLVTVFGAALFDYIEDAFMFLNLGSTGPPPFVSSLIKWGLLGASFLVIGIAMLRRGEAVYSFATRALLGIAHCAAGMLMLVAVAAGKLIGYSLLELGVEVFAYTVLVNLVGLLGPMIGSWFPGKDLVYVEDFCAKTKAGVTSGPAVAVAHAADPDA